MTAGIGQVGQAKQAIRERVWSLLERRGVVEPGLHGYIPAYSGADQAAERLTALPFWVQAQVLKVVPDRARLPVRVRALESRQAGLHGGAEAGRG